jgi:hypothetical protein
MAKPDRKVGGLALYMSLATVIVIGLLLWHGVVSINRWKHWCLDQGGRIDTVRVPSNSRLYHCYKDGKEVGIHDF